MRIHTFPVSPFVANCYLVSGDDESCIVVDPGVTGADSVVARCEEESLQPVAVLLTHGHLDHGGDAHVVAARFDIPVYCHVADQEMLGEPAKGLGQAFAGALGQWGITTLPVPDRLLDHPEQHELAGLTITTIPAPGHTPGSVLLEVGDADERVLFSGDVLFAGAIGRTDLPGGSMAEMTSSLRLMATRTDHALPVLPGHGPATTLAAELQTNPYLTSTFLEG